MIRNGLLSADEPSTWTDLNGHERPTPKIRGRLKFGKIPLHWALRVFVLLRDEYRCCLCGSVCASGDPRVSRLVLDHIISRRNGGSHHPLNLQAVCVSCNARKSSLVDSKVVSGERV